MKLHRRTVGCNLKPCTAASGLGSAPTGRGVVQVTPRLADIDWYTWPPGRGLHSLTSKLNLTTFGTHRSRSGSTLAPSGHIHGLIRVV